MNPFVDFSFQRLLYQACAAVVIIATHGLFLALAARLLGDRGPEYDGRLTLNPFRHLEPIGAFALFFTQFGWVKPVTIEREALAGRMAGPLLVAVFALAASLALGWALWQLRPLAFTVLTGGTFGVTVVGLLETTARSSLAFVLVNLIPILPLTAGHLLIGIAPRLAELLNRFRLIIGAVMAGLILWGLSRGLGATVLTLARSFYG
ncbi:hypothetical protein [Pelagibacterium mangrovi]|uniref:hypothetical protein n=1 Tax=Pelagibacterium mangrovi TaxID=3119828 RepID=UPI002FC68516